MKITDSVKGSPGLPVGQTQTQATSARNAEKANSAQVPTSTDSVRLSPQLPITGGENCQQQCFPTAKKSKKIKLAIADGQFQVNSEKVADGLLETVKDLLHSRKR